MTTTVDAPAEKVTKRARPLTDDLKEVVESERGHYQNETKRSLRFYWDRGRVAEAVKRQQSLTGAGRANYGANPVDALADALGVDRSAVYRQIHFFGIFPTASQYERFAERALVAGVSWAHISVCMSAPPMEGDDPHVNRRKILEDAIAGKWTVRQLVEKLEKRFMKHRPGDGRTGPKMALKVVARCADKFRGSYIDRITRAIEAISDMPSDDVDTSLLELLAKDVVALNEVADLSSRAAEQASSVLQKHKKALGRD